jgi:hypothetical protein
VKVSPGANQPAGKASHRGVSKAKPLTMRTTPFTFWLLLAWFLEIGGAAGLIYWVGADCFRTWAVDGAFEISRLEIGVLVFAVAALCWLVTQCWKYFDPYPEVRISPGAAALGTSFDVEWTFGGSKRRLRSIAMALEGREEVWAENKVGERARAQKLTAPFYIEEIDMLQRLDQGQVHVQLPEGLMPSFQGEKAKIVWLIRFENQIKWGARMKYEFPVQVLPEVAHG